MHAWHWLPTWIRARVSLRRRPFHPRSFGLRPRGREPSELDAAFAAGIATKSLDNLVKAEPQRAGCWRARLALKCAAVASAAAPIRSGTASLSEHEPAVLKAIA